MILVSSIHDPNLLFPPLVEAISELIQPYTAGAVVAYTSTTRLETIES